MRWPRDSDQGNPPPVKKPTPKCDVQFVEQDIPNVPMAYHTYIETTVNGLNQFYEATNSPKSNPTSVNWTPLCLVGGCWLNKQTGVTGSTYDFASVLTVDIVVPNECAVVTNISSAFGLYRNNTHTYGTFLGPNSNSFTHSLLLLGGVSDFLADSINSLASGLGFPLVGWDASVPWP